MRDREGRHIQSTVASADVALLIRSLHDYGYSEFRNAVITNLFDPDTSRAVQLFACSVPPKGFLTRKDAHWWVTEYKPLFDEDVLFYKQLRNR